MQTVKKGSWQKTQLALQECTKCGIEKPAKSLDSLGICKGGCGGQVAPVANRGIQAEAEQPLVWLTKIMRQVISAQPEFERRMPENVGSVEVGLSEYCQLAAKAIYETLSGMQLQEKTGQEAILRKEIARLHEQIAKLEALHQKDGQAFEEMLPDVGKAAGLQLEVDALRARKDQLQNAVYVKEREIEASRLPRPSRRRAEAAARSRARCAAAARSSARRRWCCRSPVSCTAMRRSRWRGCLRSASPAARPSRRCACGFPRPAARRDRRSSAFPSRRCIRRRRPRTSPRRCARGTAGDRAATGRSPRASAHRRASPRTAGRPSRPRARVRRPRRACGPARFAARGRPRSAGPLPPRARPCAPRRCRRAARRYRLP